MIKTKPGFLSETNGILLMERADLAMEPYIHADSLVEWLDEHGMFTVANALRRDIFIALGEYGSIQDQL